ncbi:C-terminal binding protein [Candidatus Aerophobetes bacterium]|uniref:C-terminal binding protein n=1 Tax=Aerophobetes bacterium TaxID=2030807 RepID=A0A662DG75_UNCAE|nr:MAG: C-terminal binding protein [Candidatus Aerophobetes bacterium]
MSRYKVVVTDYNYPDLEKEKNILKQIDAELIPAQCKTEDDVIKVAAEADALLNQYAPITEKVIANLKRCRVIARYGIGVDNIDVRAATKKGIMVVNVPSYCEDEVSDHALALILSCVRKIFRYNQQIRKGTWDWKTEKPIHSLSELILGLVGFGKIARSLARKAKCLGFKVVAFTPRKHEKLYKKEGVERMEFDILLKISDVISIHAPLNESTRHLFGEREFNLMKPSAYLVNTARGALIDERALYEALVNKRIAGAALDVLETEFPDASNPLFQLDNVIFTPHAAWYSEASLEKLQTKPALDIVRALKGEIPEGLVNRELIQSD